MFPYTKSGPVVQESQDCMNTMHTLPWLPLGQQTTIFFSFPTCIGSLLDCDLIAYHVTCYWYWNWKSSPIEACIDFYQHLFCVVPQVVQISSTGESEYFWAIHALMRTNHRTFWVGTNHWNGIWNGTQQLNHVTAASSGTYAKLLVILYLVRSGLSD